MLGVQNADVYTDFNGLSKLKSEARKQSPEAVKEVARQFEAIFLSNVLKGMREAKLADGLMDNDQSKFYSEMYDQQLAMHLSGSPGLGLADLIVKQLGRDQPENEKSANEKNQKLELEDYLNRSAGTPKVISAQRSGIDKQVDNAADNQSKSPVEEIFNTPLKNESALPIESAGQFINQLQPYAEQAAKQLGVEPRVILAQAALETGWGRALIKNSNGGSSFNLFNIKADKDWHGKQVQVTALELDQGIAKQVNSGFRSYDSFQESFQDYVDFIKSNPRYGEALKQAGNANHYMQALQQAGYATDPHYADKVMGIYQGNALAGFKPDTVIAMNP
ncbi:Peptidoglycan hydrolase FlgJ [Candidatus Methylobacter favarea]|uniref:Peptidoglycan hydrolase FlgJ n=1 Tax=Candidatus Methylobacter favarea TaxID=2707345 RepID=A0A8S0WCQ4_9GAMM|nr:flagellar assembly peptidoglycan hydrolase FlgJ [Candidatus Methylobacter favarea]CAA9892695.1 Peptidoglycan hydrolase FlgJ [Candidatus Methylobacter favarea]